MDIEKIAHELTLIAIPDAIKNDDLLDDLVGKGLADENSKANQYVAAYRHIYKALLRELNKTDDLK